MWTKVRLVLFAAALVACRTPAQKSQPTAALAAPIHPIHVVSVRYLPDSEHAGDKGELDVYVPEGEAGLPVAVSLHGGALIEGDKTDQAFVGRRLAASGIAAVVVNYRLSPQVVHPRHIEDVAASVSWVKRHIAEYGGDPGQLFVVGHSAGAYLAALLATDARYLAAEGLSLRDLRGVALVSGFFWVERVAPDRPSSVWGTDPKTWVDASPAHHLGPGMPPALLLYADGDDAWRRDQNVEMAAALRAAGDSEVEIARIDGRDHRSIWGEMKTPGDPVAERIVRFVQERRSRP